MKKYLVISIIRKSSNVEFSPDLMNGFTLGVESLFGLKVTSFIKSNSSSNIQEKH